VNTEILVLYKHKCLIRKDAALLDSLAEQKKFFFVTFV